MKLVAVNGLEDMLRGAGAGCYPVETFLILLVFKFGLKLVGACQLLKPPPLDAL